MGMVVDEVLEVLSISANRIEPPPDLGAGAAHADFLLGVGKADKRVIFLLDIGKVLEAEDVKRIDGTLVSA